MMVLLPLFFLTLILTMWMSLKLFCLPKKNGLRSIGWPNHLFFRLTPLQLHGTSTILSNKNLVITTFVMVVFQSLWFFPSHNRFVGSRKNSCPPSTQIFSWKTIKHIYQIYHKTGHTTDRFWHRYDPSPTHSFNANMTQYAFSVNQDSIPSILGAPSTIEDPLWYPDSGATHHVTNDSNIFTNK